MSESDPRQIALDILARVETGAFLDLLVGEAHRRHPLSPPDAALLVRLAYGVEVWRKRLDWTLEQLVDRPLDRLDPPVRAGLRLGLLQLRMLDRIPAHAAVDTSVSAVRRRAGRGAAGLVNAVLRRCASSGAERPLPSAEQDPARSWSIRWSHPEWLVRQWIAELGQERTLALLAANDEPAPTVLRVDRRVRSRAQAIEELAARGVPVRPGAHALDAIRVDGPIGPTLALPWVHAQGEASQLVVDLLAPRSSERILDACAAPGGKSGAIAERRDADRAAPAGAATSTSPALVAADRSRAGLRRLAGLAHASDWNVAVVRADLGAAPFGRESFDAVLLDAPCSGLGTLRAHPEMRWRRELADVVRLAELQRTLISAAAELVRPGGRLVYSTCTLMRSENEDVIDGFLSAHPSFRRSDPRPDLPASAATLVGSDLALRTAPDVDEMDGFFAIRLDRES